MDDRNTIMKKKIRNTTNLVKANSRLNLIYILFPDNDTI